MSTNMQQPLEITLEKALDKSKLVQVQVTVHGKNGTFTRMQWKNPADVKSTDKVIGNQSVLDQYLKDKKHKDSMQTVAKNNFNQSTFDQLKNQGKKDDAMKYAKLSGVVWNEHPNPNINWMRCNMAINKLGSISLTIPPTKKLDTSNISASWNTLGKKEKMAELLKNNSRQELMEYAKANGVTWKEDPTSEGINWMRASMAIQRFIEGKSLLELDSTAKFNSSNSQNSSAKQSTPKPPSDKLEIPATATEREKALLTMINNISDEDDLKLFKSTGMIAEDDDAKEFLKSKLSPRYEEWKKNHSAVGNVSGKRGRQHYSSSDWGKDSAKGLGSTVFKGIPQKLLARGMTELCDDLSIAQLLYPRETVPVLNGFQRPYEVRISTGYKRSMEVDSMLRYINTSFSTYSEDSSEDTTKINHRYNSYQYTFSEDKDGFCSVLKHISEECPKLSKECDRMKSVYLEMMHDCNDKYTILNTVLIKSFSSIQKEIKNFEKLKKKRKKTIEVLRQQGLTDEEIIETIKRGDYCNKVRLFDKDGNLKEDSAGNTITINLRELVGKDENDSYYYNSYEYFSWNEPDNYKKYFLKDGNDGITDYEEKEYDKYKSITFDLYKKVKANSLKMYGVKFVKLDSSGKPNGDADLLNLSEDDWNKLDSGADSLFAYSVDDSVSSEVDTVLANLQMIRANHDMKERIHDNVSYDCIASQANDGGTRYEGNFDWLSPKNAIDGKTYFYSKAMTSSEVTNKLRSQLKSIPVVTPEFLDGMKKFVDENGNENYDTYKTAVTTEEAKYRKAYSYELRSEDSIGGFKGTPIHDLIVPHMKDLANYCPQMKTARYNTKQKLHKYVEDKMEYKPFDFSTLKANQSQNPQAQQAGIEPSKLKKMREELAKAVHCSLRTCNKSTNDSNETNVKHNWDKGMRSSGGSRLYGHITAVFHKSYEVRNSLQEEKFKENCKKTGETPQTYFHGTNHSGACGIIGVDGAFRVPKNSSDASRQGLKYAGAMLGPGIYLADMAGKSAGYFGNWGGGYNKEGCMLICEAILGKHYTATNYSGSSAGSQYDSVSMKAGTNTGRTVLRADEWCVRKPDFVFPKYIMDMEVKNR